MSLSKLITYGILLGTIFVTLFMFTDVVKNTPPTSVEILQPIVEKQQDNTTIKSNVKRVSKLRVNPASTIIIFDKIACMRKYLWLKLYLEF